MKVFIAHNGRGSGQIGNGRGSHQCRFYQKAEPRMTLVQGSRGQVEQDASEQGVVAVATRVPRHFEAEKGVGDVVDLGGRETDAGVGGAGGGQELGQAETIDLDQSAIHFRISDLSGRHPDAMKRGRGQAMSECKSKRTRRTSMAGSVSSKP